MDTLSHRVGGIFLFIDIICSITISHIRGFARICPLQKISNLQAMARWVLRNSLSHKVGRVKYSMAESEKIKRITFSLDPDHLHEHLADDSSMS